MLRKLVKIANILDQRGLYTEANVIDRMLKVAMGSSLVNPMIPDDQLNIENQGSGVGRGSGFGVDEAMRADDGSGYQLDIYEINKRLNYFRDNLESEKNPVIYKKYMDHIRKLEEKSKELLDKKDRRLKQINRELDEKLDEKKAKKRLLNINKILESDDIEETEAEIFFLNEKYELESYLREIEQNKENSIEQDTVDVASVNGLQGSTSIDRNNFNGFSDAYMYRGVGSIEDNM